MPRFVAKPITVEAVQYNGSVTELPPRFAEAILTFSPGRAAKARTADGIRDLEPMDWLVRGPDGEVRVMRPGFMDLSYERVPDESHAPQPGEMAVTFIGDPAWPENTPNTLDWLGVRFVLNHPVGVSDPRALAQFRANTHFRVEPVLAPETPADAEDFDPYETQPRKRGRPSHAERNPRDQAATSEGLSDAV